MPALARLLQGLFGDVYAVIVAFVSSLVAARVAAIGLLATAYVACVTGFTAFAYPLISSLFSTQYGQVIGLAFPPISGTVLAGFVTVWGCIVAKNYTARLVKFAAG